MPEVQIPPPGKSAAGIYLSVELWGNVLSGNGTLFSSIVVFFFSLKITPIPEILEIHAGVFLG